MKKNILHMAISATAITAAGSVVSLSALAQSESPLEEIVITSERREVNLQDTPISATVLSAEAMIRKGVDNISDIQQVAPSIAINQYNRSTFINIRGVGIAQSAPTSNPGVAYYIDGVLIPHEQFIGQSFYDLNSIEVLRGPQGTLTGQNSTGGAVYVRSPEPVVGEFLGYIDQTFGSNGWYRTVSAVNIPMGDIVALRLASVVESKDGFVDNKGFSASEPGSSDLRGLRANMLIQPSDTSSFRLSYENFDLKSGNNAVKDRNDPNSDPFEISEDGRSFMDQKGYRASLEGRWGLTDDLELRALYSTQSGYTKDQTDGDRTSTALPVPAGLPASGANRAIYPGRVSRAQTDFETEILEINLLSGDDGDVTWVVGGFYMTDDVPVILERDNHNTLDFFSSDSDIIAEAENTSASVFGQIDISFTDVFGLTFGLRYSDDEQVYTRVAVPGPVPPGCYPCATTQESTATTGRIGLNFNISDDTLLYTTISKGYKAGGVNLAPTTGFFEPEENTVLELGFKTTIADGHLRINGDVFFSDYTDIQLSSLMGPVPVTQNAAEGEIYGLELELQGVYDALSFNFGVSLLNGTFTKDVVLNDTIARTNVLLESGDDLPFTPNLTANAGIQYDFYAGDVVIAPRFQVSFIDDQLATPFVHPETKVESRTIADLKLIIEPNEQLLFEVFVNNVFDEEYVASQIQNSSSATGGPIYGAPRQFGMRVKYDF